MTSTPVFYGSERLGPTAPTSNDSRISAPDNTLQSTAGSHKSPKTHFTRYGRKPEDPATKENVPLADSRSRSRAPRTKSSWEVVTSPTKKQKTTHLEARQEEEVREWNQSESEVALPKSLSLSQNDDTIPFSKNHKIDSHVPNEDNIRPKVEVREERDGNGIGGENSSTEKGKGKEKEIEAMEAKPKLEDDGGVLMPVSKSTLYRLPRSSGPSPEPEPTVEPAKGSNSTLPRSPVTRLIQVASPSKHAARSMTTTSNTSTAASAATARKGRRHIPQEDDDFDHFEHFPSTVPTQFEHCLEEIDREASVAASTSIRRTIEQPSSSPQRCASTSTISKHKSVSLAPSHKAAFKGRTDFAMPFALPGPNLELSLTLESRNVNSSQASPANSVSDPLPLSSLEAQLLLLGNNFSFFVRGQKQQRGLDFLAVLFRQGGYGTGNDLRCLQSCEAGEIVGSLRERYEKSGSPEGRVADIDWLRMGNQLRKGLAKQES